MDHVGNEKTLGKETTEQNCRVWEKNGVQTQHGKQQNHLITQFQADAQSGPFAASVGVDGSSVSLLVLFTLSLVLVMLCDRRFFSKCLTLIVRLPLRCPKHRVHTEGFLP